MEQLIAQVVTIARGMWRFRWQALAIAWLVALIGTVIVFRVPDKFEAQPATFFAKVRAGYRARFDATPKRFARIAAEQGREAVWQDVLASVQQRGWLA